MHWGKFTNRLGQEIYYIPNDVVVHPNKYLVKCLKTIFFNLSLQTIDFKRTKLLS